MTPIWQNLPAPATRFKSRHTSTKYPFRPKAPLRSSRKTILTLALLSLLAALARAADEPATATAPASAPATTPAAVALTISDADNGKTITAPLGTTITISLAANATTGYSWSLAKIDGTAVTAAGDIQYTPNNARGLVGSGGTATATFRAAKEGKATITLNYARPWEKDTPPAKTFTVKIEVNTPAP